MSDTSIADQAYGQALDIMNTYEPMPLAEGADAKIQEILDAYEEELNS